MGGLLASLIAGDGLSFRPSGAARIDPRRGDRHRGVGTGARSPDRVARDRNAGCGPDGSRGSGSAPPCSSSASPRRGAASSRATRNASSGRSTARATDPDPGARASCRPGRSAPCPRSRSSRSSPDASASPRAWPSAARSRWVGAKLIKPLRRQGPPARGPARRHDPRGHRGRPRLGLGPHRRRDHARLRRRRGAAPGPLRPVLAGDRGDRGVRSHVRRGASAARRARRRRPRDDDLGRDPAGRGRLSQPASALGSRRRCSASRSGTGRPRRSAPPGTGTASSRRRARAPRTGRCCDRGGTRSTWTPASPSRRIPTPVSTAPGTMEVQGASARGSSHSTANANDDARIRPNANRIRPGMSRASLSFGRNACMATASRPKPVTASEPLSELTRGARVSHASSLDQPSPPVDAPPRPDGEDRAEDQEPPPRAVRGGDGLRDRARERRGHAGLPREVGGVVSRELGRQAETRSRGTARAGSATGRSGTRGRPPGDRLRVGDRSRRPGPRAAP